ncbi:MAG: FliM/FliN family flagellar motor switch protein, partial [Paracoccaceae bacterium]
MSLDENISVLQRKVNARAPQPEPLGMSPAKALRLAVARACEEVAGMEASVSGFVQEKTTVDAIIAALGEPHLIFLTEGPDGAIGLALLNAQAMAAIIEQLTTGRVVPGRAEPREATRTDAVVVATVLDRLLEVFDDGLGRMQTPPPVAGFRQAVSLPDGRAVKMALEEMPYRLFRLSLDFSHGAKTGELRLIFPFDLSDQGASDATLQARWRNQWHQALSQTQTDVEAVLHRFSLPLDEIESLRVGALIPVPASAVAAVSLEGGDGRCVATGKLGQCGGHRAVRIISGELAEAPPTVDLSAQDMVLSDVDEVGAPGAGADVDVAGGVAGDATSGGDAPT